MIDNTDLQHGVSALLQVAGVGKMKPNILLLGYKNDWQVCDQPSLNQYFNIIQYEEDVKLRNINCLP